MKGNYRERKKEKKTRKCTVGQKCPDAENEMADKKILKAKWAVKVINLGVD